jgi:phage shock protein C
MKVIGMSAKRLYRSRKNSVVSGVCGGIGDYFDIDPVIVRIITVVLIFNGVGLLAYIIGALIIPLEPFNSEYYSQKQNHSQNQNFSQANESYKKSENTNVGNQEKSNFFEDDTLDGEKIVEVDLEEDSNV